MHPLKRVLIYAKNYKNNFFLSVILAIIYVTATLVAPIIIGLALDQITDSAINTNKILMYLLILLAIIILGAISGYLMNILISKVTFQTVKDLRKDAFNKVLNVPVKTLDTHSHGDIISRIITDIDVVQDGLLQSFTEALTGIITIIFTLIFMLVLNYQIGLVVVALTPLSLFVAMLIAKLSFKTIKNTSIVKGDLTGFINEMFESQKVVLAYDQMDDNQAKFEQLDDILYTHGVNAQFYSSLSNPSTRFVNAIIYLVVATFGALSIIRGSELLTVGLLSTFLSYASQYTKPFNSISAVWAELQNSIASLRRIFEWLDEEEIKVNESQEISLDGDIIFNDVKFGYNESRLIIDDFNLDVKKGQKIAFVGPTGCGKTTLINLLMKFYDINEGVITIDGKPLDELGVKTIRSNIGMVLQDTWLFNGTIYENISYGAKNATKEEVIEAAKQAFCHDFIMRLPNGYDTFVSQDEGVSEGQKQLLCIARLMLRLPHILILDEATSNIDTRTEIKVQEAFNKLMEGKTAFIIAHRLQTIKNADKIVVLKDGKIMEVGTHKELLEKGGFYKEIYNAQFQTN